MKQTTTVDRRVRQLRRDHENRKSFVLHPSTWGTSPVVSSIHIDRTESRSVSTESPARRIAQKQFRVDNPLPEGQRFRNDRPFWRWEAVFGAAITDRRFASVVLARFCQVAEELSALLAWVLLRLSSGG